jgi:hypothetical protein
MGLHGYRIGVGEYGRIPLDRRGIHPFIDPFHGRFLGWTPRQQDGFHMRRVGGAMFMQGAPIVPERPDGRMKPGELQNGGYGFYYKGEQQKAQVPEKDVLEDLKSVIIPIEVRPRPQEPALAYNMLITSNVYFSNEKWQEVLSSHGIVVDKEAKTLTIQSSTAQQDFVYDITPEEANKLTSNSIKDVPVEERLNLINGIIKNDFADKVTMDMLNSKEQISIKLTPAVESEINQRQEAVLEYGHPIVEEEHELRDVAHINGQDLYELNENKGWYREGNHGREVNVEDIKVEPVRNAQGELEKDEKGNAMFRMTAVINGESISHEITEKQYDKFMAIDDYHRMKLFSKIFDEVDMKNVPEARSNIGAKIGGALLAGLAVMSEIGRSHSGPSIFLEHHDRPHVYFKPGVDSPRDLASRAFDAGVNAAEHGVGLGR